MGEVAFSYVPQRLVPYIPASLASISTGLEEVGLGTPMQGAHLSIRARGLPLSSGWIYIVCLLYLRKVLDIFF